MTCPICGSTCPDSAKFCPECGVRLPDPQPPEQPPVPEAAEPPAPEIPAPSVCESVEPAVPQVPESPAPEAVHIPPAAEVPEQPPVFEAPTQPAPRPPKRGTHWIPIAIMVLLCVMGLTLYFALPYETESPGYSSGSETPWFYNDNGTLFFNEAFYTGPEELIIPATVDGQSVTAIGAWGFSECCSVTTVILPDTVTSVNANAFYGSTSIQGVFLPEGLTYIGTDAFGDCTSLEAICVPSTVETIEEGAFDGCISLSYILYNGIHSHWKDLYHDHISMNTQVYCTDGTFVHRQQLP